MPSPTTTAAHSDPPTRSPQTTIEQAFTRPFKSDRQRAKEKAALRRLLGDFDTEIAGQAKTGPIGKGQPKAEARNIVESLRDRMEHRKQLRRARRAVRKTFGVDIRPSARRRATLMMGLGAMTLGSVAASGSSSVLSDRDAVVAAAQIDATKQRVHVSQIKVSDDFKQALIEEEGVRKTVYRDVAGYPTVGVGHLVRSADGLSVGERVSYDQVLDFLERDLATAEEGVRNLVGDLPLYQHEFDALVDLVYNVGEGNVSDRNSPRLNAAIMAGDYETIADELHYTTAAGRTAKGLEYRSERRATIFEQASYENPRDA